GFAPASASTAVNCGASRSPCARPSTVTCSARIRGAPSPSETTAAVIAGAAVSMMAISTVCNSSARGCPAMPEPELTEDVAQNGLELLRCRKHREVVGLRDHRQGRVGYLVGQPLCP